MFANVSLHTQVLDSSGILDKNGSQLLRLIHVNPMSCTIKYMTHGLATCSLQPTRTCESHDSNKSPMRW